MPGAGHSFLIFRPSVEISRSDRRSLHCIKELKSQARKGLREIFARYSLNDKQVTGPGEYVVTASEAVIERFLDEDAKFLAQVSATLNCSIKFQTDPAVVSGNFDIRFSDNSSL